MRLIDADALLDKFEWKVTSPLYIRIIRTMIGAAPTIDAVKHGRWEYIGGYGYKHRCSECFMCAERISKYCSNCGARMDGEKDDNK